MQQARSNVGQACPSNIEIPQGGHNQTRPPSPCSSAGNIETKASLEKSSNVGALGTKSRATDPMRSTRERSQREEDAHSHQPHGGGKITTRGRRKSQDQEAARAEEDVHSHQPYGGGRITMSGERKSQDRGAARAETRREDLD